MARCSFGGAAWARPRQVARRPAIARRDGNDVRELMSILYWKPVERGASLKESLMSLVDGFGCPRSGDARIRSSSAQPRERAATDIAMQHLILVAYRHGLRVGEPASLRWDTDD